jgi:hypothetical protein
VTSRSRSARDRRHPALTETLGLLGLPRHKPTDADRPPVSTLPGRKVKPLLGQLELGQNEPEAG